MTIFYQWLPANWTIHIRQVIPTTIGTIGNEFAILAMRAAPMRRQRINLRDPRHCSDKRRTDGTTGTDQVTIVIGLFNQSLGDEIQHGESMANNRLQLLLETGLNDFRQIFAIHLLGLVVRHRPDFFIGPWNHR